MYFLDSILFSYAQIFFSNRRWFGAAALLSTFVIPEMGLLGLAGVVICNLFAIGLKFDKEKIKNGFYGFNGILFGAASSFFFELTPFLVLIVLIFVIIVFFLSAALEHLLANVLNLPGLSLPFILTLYIFMIFIGNYDSVFYKEMTFVDYDFLSFIPPSIGTYFKSFSLILFQQSVISGIMLVITVLIFSRVMFVNSIIAFTVNYFFVHLVFPDPSSNVLILTSFNSILASFALGGSLLILAKRTLPLLVLSTLMVIIFTGFFSKLLVSYLLPVLVLPFNFVVLATIYSLKFRQEHSDLALLYFTPGSPEENFYYHQNRKSRFDKFKYLFPELPFFGEWKISQGFEGEYTHKDDWKYAWDFVIVGDDGKEYTSHGNTVEDYYCYGTPVASPLEGEIVKVIDNVTDNKIGEANLKHNWGNTIIIDHGQGLFSSLSHLKLNSIKVKKGDSVAKGQIIAQCGNSGRSPIPHLHFQFQLTDKLGDKTYKFPFSHYLINCDGKFKLESFDYPRENCIVSNIEQHKSLKNAFAFQLGDEFKFECELNNGKFMEEWEVKVDILNNVYIENNLGAKAFLFPGEKVFYLTNFIGNKKSALYYFYLLSISIPLGYSEHLKWKDQYPVSITLNNWVRYISEFFLIVGGQIKSSSLIGFLPRDKDSNEFNIKVNLNNRGKGLFSFYNEEGTGEIIIENEGFIKSFSFNDNSKKFIAKLHKEEEE